MRLKTNSQTERYAFNKAHKMIFQLIHFILILAVLYFNQDDLIMIENKSVDIADCKFRRNDASKYSFTL